MFKLKINIWDIKEMLPLLFFYIFFIRTQGILDAITLVTNLVEILAIIIYNNALYFVGKKVLTKSHLY
jgi:hypothetical protein